MSLRVITSAVILFLLFGSVVKSQEKITHEKRIYAAPDEKIYIQKELPLYLRVATSPDKNTESFLLKSEETKKYANPFYLDTEGYNTVRSPSCVDTTTKHVVYPLTDVIFEVYADSRPPVSKMDYGKYYLFSKGNKFYTKGELKLKIKSRDEMSGVNKIYYSIDSASYKEFKDSIYLNEEKEYVIKYYAIDNVGNDEEIKTVNLILDSKAPVSELEFKGDKYEDIISGRTSISIVSEDQNGVAQIYFSMDNSPFKKYSYSLQAKYLSEGEHTLKYYAVDNIKNTESERTYSFYVDKTPPTIVQEVLGNSIIANGQEYSSGRSKLKLTTFDNKAGVKEIYYSINGGKYELYTQPFYLTSASGKLSIKAYALDNVNNKSTDNQETSKSSIPYIDLSGPVIKNRFKGPVFYTRDTVYINKETKLILQAKDDEAGLNKITYSVDGNSIDEYKEPFSIQNEGMHSIAFTAADNVDNTNSSEFRVYVDNTGPEIYSRFSTQPVKVESGKEIYPSYVVLFFSATDMVVGFNNMNYLLNASTTPKPYDGYIMGFERDKDYKVVVKAYDKLGNQTEQTVTFKTDTF